VQDVAPALVRVASARHEVRGLRYAIDLDRSRVAAELCERSCAGPIKVQDVAPALVRVASARHEVRGLRYAIDLDRSRVAAELCERPYSGPIEAGDAVGKEPGRRQGAGEADGEEVGGRGGRRAGGWGCGGRRRGGRGRRAAKPKAAHRRHLRVCRGGQLSARAPSVAPCVFL
jgi:hypothetical protein